ncbi:RING finger protein 207 isoform X7 [Pseudoliparis swirei]|uniref:RING finger protein 207 isoform X7 n=1 Tax=Pseudoliparis swirei TaxID=2059687 RepID=UPI0024BDE386|nr:RING finger protein 207 isoform X7 [Pseudoliparis swirei]
MWHSSALSRCRYSQMAGGIFTDLGNLCNVDCANVHPLVCHLCREQYQSPCLLDCYHIFCARCLRGRTSDGHLSCPLCGYPSILRGNSSLPPEDRLLKFLVDNSADAEESVQCANCDQESSKKLHCGDCFPVQDAGGMYYCNTCSQPLCGACRESTHKARMFSHHEIVSLAQRSRAKHRKCPLHEEPYILFSTENKSMLCIKCFRDMQVESRTHCIDIETAHMQGCEMLDRAVLVRRPAGALVCRSLQMKCGEGAADLGSGGDPPAESHDRRSVCERGGRGERDLLSVQQLAGKTSGEKEDSAESSSEINTDYRSEFARCLEPSLQLGQRGPPSAVAARHQSPLSVASPSLSEMPLGSLCSRRPTCHRNICTKVLLAEGRETAFTEHCRSYEGTYRTLQAEIQNLKDQVQELHRDLTKHHSVINTDRMGEVTERSLHIDSQIASQHAAVETMRGTFEEVWDETFQRVTNEQDIYEAQLHDLMQLKQENSYLTTITRQISPYILSIAKVKERLEPRFQEPKKLHDDRTETMLKVYEESAVAKDGQDGDSQPCVADPDRHKNNRPPILESADGSVKTGRPARPRVATETSSHNETPS